MSFGSQTDPLPDPPEAPADTRLHRWVLGDGVIVELRISGTLSSKQVDRLRACLNMALEVERDEQR